MNIIKLMGGLGNQLFQYAFAERQRKNGITVCFDDSWYQKRRTPKDRQYILDKFNTQVDVVGFDSDLNTIIEQGYNTEYLTIKGYNFRGYWQYLNYYRDIISSLRESFTLKEKFFTSEYKQILDKIFCKKKVIGVHIRRGDYMIKKLALDHFYYDSALDIMKKLVLFDRIVIFTDDYEFCKKKYPDCICISGKNAYLDFELMKRCTHNIISNSTFSWWAAILNNNKDKKVIAPKYWVIPKGQERNYSPLNHYPEDWILI